MTPVVNLNSVFQNIQQLGLVLHFRLILKSHLKANYAKLFESRVGVEDLSSVNINAGILLLSLLGQVKVQQ